MCRERLAMILRRLRSLRDRLRAAPITPGVAGVVDIEPVVERHTFWFADMPHEERVAFIAALGQRAGAVGCVVVEGDPAFDACAVIFAGNLERFHMFSAAANLACKIIYLQDLASGWYQGSAVLPDLETLCRGFLAREIGGKPALFFGQSSGAYAALVASTFFPRSTVVACAPQTHADAAAKAKIHFVGIRPLPTPHDILDVRNRMATNPDPETSTTVVIAASEADNPIHFHFWMDYLHALRLWDLPHVQVSVVNARNHAIVHGNARAYAELLHLLTAELQAPASRRDEIVRAFLERTYAPEPAPVG